MLIKLYEFLIDIFCVILNFTFFISLAEFNNLLSDLLLKSYKKCKCNPLMYPTLVAKLNKLEDELNFELSARKKNWFGKAAVNPIILKDFQKKFKNIFTYYNEIHFCLSPELITITNKRLQDLYLLLKKLY